MDNTKVYNVAGYDESATCDHLYFKKQVHDWGRAKVNNIVGSCPYSQPSALVSGKWNQLTEKLARTSLMFTDVLSMTSPAQGIQISHGDDAAEPLWETTLHYVSFPWSLESGFRTMETGYLKIRFGDPDRTALIWGMQFMKEQVQKRGTNSMKIAYNYYKDAERGLYAADAKRSLTSLNPLHETNEISFSLSDIDDNGLYFFKHPDNPAHPLKIVASSMSIEFKSHYFNFDFLGTFYDYDTAWDGKHSDNKDDNFNSRVMGSFWITGEITRSNAVILKILPCRGWFRNQCVQNTRGRSSRCVP